MLRKGFLLIIVILLIFNAALSAQKPEADIYFLESTLPIIDGQIDELWLNVEAHNIDNNFQSEDPTISFATWKAAWTEEGIYVLVEVSDDVWLPSWISGMEDWQSDKIELYFDTSDPLEDGLGASNQYGNWQVAGDFTEVDMGSQQIISDVGQAVGAVHADVYDSEGYYVKEYFVPFSSITDSDGNIIDPTVCTQIGFDVTVVDLDEIGFARQRAVWANIGDRNESWFDMDDVGLINFIAKVNEPPVANAGNDQQVMETEEILLDGSASTDDFGIRSYLWESIEGLEIPRFTSVVTTIEAPRIISDFDFHFVLTVSDGEFSEKDTVIVSVVNKTSGLNNNSTVKSLNVSPNPASKFANIIFDSQNAGMVTIQVISSAGKIIEQKNIDSNLGENEYSLDVTEYSNGIYFVVINNGISIQKEKMLILK